MMAMFRDRTVVYACFRSLQFRVSDDRFSRTFHNFLSDLFSDDTVFGDRGQFFSMMQSCFKIFRRERFFGIPMAKHGSVITLKFTDLSVIRSPGSPRICLALKKRIRGMMPPKVITFRNNAGA